MNTIEPTLSRASLNRRNLVLGGAALGAGLAGAGAFTRFAAAQSDTAATPSATATAITGIVSAANAFLATLNDDERGSVLFAWSDDEQKARWSNFPEGLFERDGLMWENLTESTQDAWLVLMQATLSEEGYARVIAEWTADDVLAAEGTSGGGPGGGPGGMMYGRQYYWIALIGEPSESTPWQWQFGGHHITVNATIANGNIALTPSFIGVQPATYTDERGNEVRPLGDIVDDAFALVNALDADQQAAAILGNQYIDLVLGPGQDGETIAPEGLLTSELTEDQLAIFTRLVSHYTGLVHADLAAARLEEVTSLLDETYFAWYGPTTEGEAAYFRVAGPTIVIEYAPQQQLTEDPSEHIHGIYRDPSNDYGVKYVG